MTPSNLKEAQLVNYGLSCELHKLITIYKGFSDNKFVEFLNEFHQQCDDNGKPLYKFESANAVKLDGEMKLAVFFDDGRKEADLYLFKSEQVKNWFRNYLDKCINKIDWK